MSAAKNNNKKAGDSNGEKAPNLPSVNINAQYVKDLSFENPRAPASLAPNGQRPDIDIALNLEAKEIGENNFEVSIQITAKAVAEKESLFVVELTYAGLFTIVNIPEEQKELVLLVHCPTILFPFARRIIADVTRDGSFNPLMIDPIDFGTLYMQRKNQENGAKPEKAESIN